MSEETLCMKTRLERVALCADISSHYVQDMRVMPASGVARVAWDAMDYIDALEAERNKLLHRATIAEEWRDSDRQRAIDAEAKLREAALSELSALGQASEAYTAQLDAETKLAKAVEALGKLCFEVAGLQAFEQGVRHEIGNTNYSAIMTRLNDGGVAIAAAKETA